MKNVITLILTVVAISICNGQDWYQSFKLESSDQQSDDNHAISVAISGNYAIAGAWHEDHNGTGGDPMSNAGAAYIYKYDPGTETWAEEAKLVAADREAGDAFGISVDISGTYAVIGAVEEEAARGAAYVFERNGSGDWVQVAKLVAPARQSSDRFGNSVAIHDNFIIVGAYHEDEDAADMNTLQNAGSAYIYGRSGGVWGFSQKIVASDRDTNDYFGYSVGIWEDKIIVGAYHRDIPTLSEYGGAYAFKFEAGMWTQTRILEAADPYLGDRFGWSVDVYDNYYIVGAPYHDYDDDGLDPKNNAGAAYIFDSDNSWAEDKVVGGDRTAQDNVGEDVAIFDERAVVGAPLQDYDINGLPPYWGNGGAAFVYEKGGSGFWNQTQKLLTNDRFTSDKFGHSVAMDGTRIIGGAPEDNSSAGPSTGALYVFNNDSLGTNDNILSSSIVAYPNPTHGPVNIDLGSHYSEVNLEVSNILGQHIMYISFNDVSSLSFEIIGSAGIYIATIETENGDRSVVKINKR